MSEIKQSSIVLCYQQLTTNSVAKMMEISSESNGNTEFYFSYNPFNSKNVEKNANIKAFIDNLKQTNRGKFFNLPTYGDVLEKIVAHPLSKNSVVPYHMGVDTVLIAKVDGAVTTVQKYLTEHGHEVVAQNMARDMGKLIEFVNTSKIANVLTFEAHRAFLAELFGANWSEVSQRLNINYFMALFGADENLLKELSTATYTNAEGKEEPLLHKARWIANYINLFKPTNKYGGGAVSDLLNTAAMFSGLDFEAIRKNNVGGKLTDLDSSATLDAFNNLNNSSAEFAKQFNVTAIIIDMEADDLAALSFAKQTWPDIRVVRVYPSQDLCDLVEEKLRPFFSFSAQDVIIIDPLLENASALKLYRNAN
jgi:hypothetical protein